MLLFNISYARHINLAFTLYGDQICVLFWDSVLIALFWTYSKTTSLAEKVVFSVAFLLTAAWLLADVNVPDSAWFVIANSSIFLVTFALGPQALVNFRKKSTGELSFVTTVMGSVGIFVRLITLLVESDDVSVYLFVITANVLSWTLFI